MQHITPASMHCRLTHVPIVALAKLMNTSRSSLDRLLDPDNPSVTLVTMESAAIALGKKLKIQLA